MIAFEIGRLVRRVEAWATKRLGALPGYGQPPGGSWSVDVQSGRSTHRWEWDSDLGAYRCDVQTSVQTSEGDGSSVRYLLRPRWTGDDEGDAKMGYVPIEPLPFSQLAWRLERHSPKIVVAWDEPTWRTAAEMQCVANDRIDQELPLHPRPSFVWLQRWGIGRRVKALRLEASDLPQEHVGVYWAAHPQGELEASVRTFAGEVRVHLEGRAAAWLAGKTGRGAAFLLSRGYVASVSVGDPQSSSYRSRMVAIPRFREPLSSAMHTEVQRRPFTILLQEGPYHAWCVQQVVHADDGSVSQRQVVRFVAPVPYPARADANVVCYVHQIVIQPVQPMAQTIREVRDRLEGLRAHVPGWPAQRRANQGVHEGAEA